MEAIPYGEQGIEDTRRFEDEEDFLGTIPMRCVCGHEWTAKAWQIRQYGEVVKLDIHPGDAWCPECGSEGGYRDDEWEAV